MADEYFLINDGQRLIRLSDLNYPMYMPQVRAATPQTSFPIPIRDYILEPFGYMPVFESAFPDGDVLVEGSPEKREDDKWYRTWTTRDFTEEEVAQNLANAKELVLIDAVNLLSYDVSVGISYEFNGESYIVDISPEKMTLLLAIKSLANEAEDTDTFEFSFMNKVLVQMSKTQFLDMWKKVFTAVYNTNQEFWHFRENVNNATTLDTVPTLPESFKP